MRRTLPASVVSSTSPSHASAETLSLSMLICPFCRCRISRQGGPHPAPSSPEAGERSERCLALCLQVRVALRGVAVARLAGRGGSIVFRAVGDGCRSTYSSFTRRRPASSARWGEATTSDDELLMEVPANYLTPAPESKPETGGPAAMFAQGVATISLGEKTELNAS